MAHTGRPCRRTSYAWLWICVVLPWPGGCVHTDRSPWSWWDRPPRGEVTQVMALWADGLVSQPDPMQNGLPMPGFAGRVYLFGPHLGQPLEARGPITVYLYDSLAPREGKPTPREMWNIDPDSLKKVLKKDGLGWGYNLWLPWSTYSADLKQVYLIVQYRNPEGRDAWSSAMPLALAGNGSGPKSPSRLHISSTHKESAK